MRNTTTDLTRALEAEAPRYEFFELTRRLMQILDAEGRGSSLRFRASASKMFPAGEVQQLAQSENHWELSVQLLGLFGPSGVLPHHDRDLVSGGQPNMLLRDFLDIFNSRLIQLFFEAWKSNRRDVLLEHHRLGLDSREDAPTRVLMSLAGRGIPTTRKNQLFHDDVFAGSIGFVAPDVRSANSFRRCLEDQFAIPLTIREFVPEKRHLPREIQTSLQLDGTGHQVLGQGAVLGESIQEFRGRIELRLGPLNREEFEEFCPYRADSLGTATNFDRLFDLAKALLDRPVDFDIRFAVAHNAVTPTRLGGTQLGFDSWVLSRPETEIREDPMKRFRWNQPTAS